MALYVASDKPLSLIPWRADAPAFHVAELKPTQESIRNQFTHLYVYYVGGHEGCGCPFNYGREYPEHEVDPVELSAAHECVARLSDFVHVSGVMQIYACQFGDEHQPRESDRVITPQQLRASEFVFKNRQLLDVQHAA